MQSFLKSSLFTFLSCTASLAIAIDIKREPILSEVEKEQLIKESIFLPAPAYNPLKNDAAPNQFAKQFSKSPAFPTIDPPNKILVFVPGGKVDPKYYQKTANAIQSWGVQSQTVKLHVIIPKCPGNLCIPIPTTDWIITRAIDKARAEIAKNGGPHLNTEDVFIAGHSLGAVAAKNYVTVNKEKIFAAVLLFGTQFDTQVRNDAQEIPQILIGGDRDGVSIANLAPQHERFQKSLKYSGYKYALAKASPVLMLQGVNHSNFCPGFDVPGDLPGELSESDFLDAIGTAVAGYVGFIALNCANIPDDPEGKDFMCQILEQGLLMKLQTSDDLLNGSIKLKNLESSWCDNVQYILSGIKNETVAEEVISPNTVTVPNELLLMHTHPKWELEKRIDGDLAGENFMNVTKMASYRPVASGAYPDTENSYAKEIACKCISGDRIAQQLKISDFDKNVTCKDVNQLAIDTAMKELSEIQKDRFKKRWGSKIHPNNTNNTMPFILEDDSLTYSNIGPLWVFYEKFVEETIPKTNQLRMTAASLDANIKSMVYPGNHYCRVVSPYRLLAWMMTDGLRNGTVVNLTKESDQETSIYI